MGEEERQGMTSQVGQHMSIFERKKQQALQEKMNLVRENRQLKEELQVYEAAKKTLEDQ